MNSGKSAVSGISRRGLVCAMLGGMLFIGAPPPLPANPVLGPDDNYTATKVWERCLVAVGDQSATVSCAIGYSLKPDPTMNRRAESTVQITLPVITTGMGKLDEKGLIKRFSPQVEAGGTIFRPFQARLADSKEILERHRAPPGTEV